jgi:hypothetical protein
MDEVELKLTDENLDELYEACAQYIRNEVKYGPGSHSAAEWCLRLIMEIKKLRALVKTDMYLSIEETVIQKAIQWEKERRLHNHECRTTEEGSLSMAVDLLLGVQNEPSMAQQIIDTCFKVYHGKATVHDIEKIARKYT